MRKTEKFFEAFTELDDDLIENAIPKEQDYDIVKPAMKMHSWKPWVAGAAVAAAAVGVAFAGMKLFGSNGKPGFAPGTQSEIYSDASVDNYNYAPFLADWRVYDTPEELVNAAQIICAGKVTDISFALLDNMTMRERDDDFYEMGDLFTIYEVEVTNGYKNFTDNKLRFAVRGGLEGYKAEEQAALTAKLSEKSIPVMEHHPEINIGEEYLFILHWADNGTPTIINNTQTAFPLHDSTYRDEFCHASAGDIINCVNGKLQYEYNCHAAVHHNNQLVSLDGTHIYLLQKFVQEAIALDCSPEKALNMAISTERIDEYRKDGLAIDIVFDDIDAPLAGGGEDKKAQTFCHATVLIGENNKASYITYSYTYSGSSEQYYGGCYFLGNISREKLLEIIGDANQNHSDSVYAPECLFDYFYLDNMQWDKTQDFTLPEFDGVTFRWSSDKITAVKNGTETELFSGMPVWSVYFADLNGDGKREICSTVSMGSGIVDNRIRAYDYAHGYLYELEDRPTSDYSLKFVDGTLMYVHSMHSAVSSVVTNPLTIGDMTCHSTTPGVHHGEETSHHEEDPGPPTYPVTTGTHHDEPEHTTTTTTVTTHHDETHH